jgi:hypothetical protein
MWVSSVRTAAAAAACLTFLVAGAAAQGYPTMLQVSPQGGGHCIEVPNGDVVPDRGLQMAECNSGAAQMFVYDPAGMHLMIGGLCVDANGGKPGDLVKLSRCAAGANQIWKSEPKGNFTKLVGGSASASTSATAPRNWARRCRAGTAAMPSRTSCGYFSGSRLLRPSPRLRGEGQAQ